MGDKEDDETRDEVNRDKVNGGVLQWHEATQNGVALNLAGYNWEVCRGAMLWWWAGWVAECADGRYDSPLVIFSCLQKMAICRVER